MLKLPQIEGVRTNAGTSQGEPRDCPRLPRTAFRAASPRSVPQSALRKCEQGARVPPPLIFRLDDRDSSAKVKAGTTLIRKIRLSGARRV